MWLPGLMDDGSCELKSLQAMDNTDARGSYICPWREKTGLWGFAKTKGADQPAHARSLISACVFRFLESIISKLATGKFSTF